MEKNENEDDEIATLSRLKPSSALAYGICYGILMAILVSSNTLIYCNCNEVFVDYYNKIIST